MSFFWMSNHKKKNFCRVSGLNRPIPRRPASGDFRAENKECNSCFTSNHFVFLCLCAWQRVWVSVNVDVCVQHGAPVMLFKKKKEKKNDQMSLILRSATTLIHSDVLLFITKWWLTTLLSALQRANLLPLRQKWRVDAQAVQAIHKVGFIELFLFFSIHITAEKYSWQRMILVGVLIYQVTFKSKGDYFPCSNF